jgi:hypothetical protein
LKYHFSTFKIIFHQGKGIIRYWNILKNLIFMCGCGSGPACPKILDPAPIKNEQIMVLKSKNLRIKFFKNQLRILYENFWTFSNNLWYKTALYLYLV